MPKVPVLNYNRILIIQTAFLGDVILITPLIRAVRQRFPHAAIDVLVIPQTKEILQNNPYINKILTFDKRANKVLGFWATLKKLRAEQYDLAVSPHSSLTSAWLMRLAGIPQRLGFDRWHAARYLTLKVAHYDDRGWHKVQKLLHLLTVFGDQKFDTQTQLFPSVKMLTQARNVLRGKTFAKRPWIAIAPGSVWFTKRWPQEYYKKLSKSLSEKKFNLLFIGAPDERALCDQIIQETGIKALNLAGTTSVLESAALLGECDLLICNDSAPLHMANAVQTPVFAFFGPTVPSIGYFPMGKDDFVFERELDCRPCGSHGSQKCPLGHFRCMRDILPRQVLEKILKRFP